MRQDAQFFSRRHLQLSDIGVRRVTWWRTTEGGPWGGGAWRGDHGGRQPGGGGVMGRTRRVPVGLLRNGEILELSGRQR